MNTEQLNPIPRMRTAAKIVAEIRAMDPQSDVSEHYVRQIIKEGAVPVTWAGNKALVNLDDVLELMRRGTTRTVPEPCVIGGIRKIDVRRAL